MPRNLLRLLGMHLIAPAASIVLFQSLPAAAACERVPCGFTGANGGQYYVAVPPDWDQVRPIGALIFFHGYKSSGAATLKNESLKAAAHRGGFLLVAADGIEGTWSHTGSPARRRNEIAYVEGVLADLKTRYPIDADKLWAVGFSQGGSMVWEVACYMGDKFKAYVAIAGAFWTPLPTSCPAGPVNMLHLHGTGDKTVPMQGRPIGRFRQGDVMMAWSLMLNLDACSATPQVTFKSGSMSCEFWTECRSGRLAQLCLHEGGHQIPNDWVTLAFDFMSRIARQTQRR